MAARDIPCAVFIKGFIEDQISGTGDVCKYCRKPTGELIEIKPHDAMEEALEVHFFKCANCHKSYTRDIER